VRAEFGRALAGAAVRYEAYCTRADGERRLLSVTNTPIRRGAEVIGVLGVARDMTDERARAMALERSEARYARLVESASDAIFTVDEDGRFTAVNRSLEEAVGRQRRELLGQSFAGLIDVRDLAIANQLLRDTFDGERRRGSLRYRAASGEVRDGSVITSPVLEDGRISGALGIMRDVTDERRLAEQMMQQEKLAAVGQLVSGVAHELNNPLAGVMAFAELLQALPSVDAEAKGAVNTIYREAQRAAKLVRHLLTFARQQPAERMAADLNAIVRDALSLRQLAFRTHDIELDLGLDAALPVTWADPFQLQQVLLNLIGNAEQALADRPAPRRIVVRTSHEGGTIRFSVSDTGIGIDPERLDRIFNPFYTTKPVGQGTGLGLSISDGIVRQHGGRILVDSEPGQGATFVVELPVVAPPANEERTEDRPLFPRTGAGRMLVVDDESAMRAAISGFLLSVGHAVDVAGTADEARALLGANEYDVVLLDLRMPGGGGEILFTELQDRDPRHAGRVVFVTGDVQSEAAQRFLSHAKRPSVSKPFQLDELAAVVAGVMS
jgi:PAS domain S-box-containing protein